MEFNIDSRVKVLEQSRFYCEIGTILAIDRDLDYIRVQLDNRFDPVNFHGVFSRDTSTLALLNHNKHKLNTWKFHSTNINDMDLVLLNSELSKKNPLLLIERGDKKYVMIHNFLVNKSKLTGIKSPIYDRILSTKLLLIQDNFSVWVDWAKKVKHSKWVISDKCLVKVNKVNI